MKCSICDILNAQYIKVPQQIMKDLIGENKDIYVCDDCRQIVLDYIKQYLKEINK